MKRETIYKNNLEKKKSLNPLNLAAGKKKLKMLQAGCTKVSLTLFNNQLFSYLCFLSKK